MNHLETYNYFYRKAYLIGLNKMKASLIEFKKSKRTFNFALNQTAQKIDLLCEKSNIENYLTLNRLYKFNNQVLKHYAVGSIALSLQNEVYSEYSKLDEDLLPLNYTFEKFIADLAVFHALNELHRVFKLEADLFEIMYVSNEYKGFNFE